MTIPANNFMNPKMKSGSIINDQVDIHNPEQQFQVFPGHYPPVTQLPWCNKVTQYIAPYRAVLLINAENWPAN